MHNERSLRAPASKLTEPATWRLPEHHPTSHIADSNTSKDLKLYRILGILAGYACLFPIKQIGENQKRMALAEPIWPWAQTFHFI